MILTSPFYPGKLMCSKVEVFQWFKQRPTALPRLLGSSGWPPVRLAEVALAVMKASRSAAEKTILIFNDANGRPLDLDLRGSERDIVARLPQPASNSAIVSRRPARAGAARARAAQARGRGPRGDAVAAALGMARGTARRRIGGAAKARGGGAHVPAAILTAAAPRETPPIISCPRWPAICRASRKPRGHCSPMIGGNLSRLSPAGPATSAITSSSLPSAIVPKVDRAIAAR